MELEMPRIFFSYARSDAEFVRRLATDVRSAGANLWVDQLDISPGDRWDRAVEEALNSSPCLLVILSPASVASQNVMDEVSFGLEKNKKIVPVLYRSCEIPFRLRRLQYIDFTSHYSEGFAQLLRALNIQPLPPQESKSSLVQSDITEIPTPPRSRMGEQSVAAEDSASLSFPLNSSEKVINGSVSTSTQKETESARPEALRIITGTVGESTSRYSVKFLITFILLIAVTGSISFLFLFSSEESEKETVKRKTDGLQKPLAAPTGGISSRNGYTITRCGSIQDSKTGLEWFVGPDRPISWGAAKLWIDSLADCGGDWQMPTIKQLATLYDSRYTAGEGFSKGGRNWPAHIHPVFASIGSGSWVWSSETLDERIARSFNFNQGVAAEYEKDNKIYTTRAFAVRTSQTKEQPE